MQPLEATVSSSRLCHTGQCAQAELSNWPKGRLLDVMLLLKFQKITFSLFVCDVPEIFGSYKRSYMKIPRDSG